MSERIPATTPMVEAAATDERLDRLWDDPPGWK